MTDMQGILCAAAGQPGFSKAYYLKPASCYRVNLTFVSGKQTTCASGGHRDAARVINAYIPPGETEKEDHENPHDRLIITGTRPDNGRTSLYSPERVTTWAKLSDRHDRYIKGKTN